MLLPSPKLLYCFIPFYIVTKRNTFLFNLFQSLFIDIWINHDQTHMFNSSKPYIICPNMKSSETSFSQRYSFLLWLIQVLFVWCCVTVVIWLSLNPKHPVFKIAVVYVQPAADHVCNSILTQAQVNEVTQNRTSTVIILNLKVSNPNKRIGYIYDDIYVGLYYEDRMIIGTSTLPGFYQGHRNSTIVREVQVNVEEQYLGGLLGKSFDMRVYLKTKVRYKIFGLKTNHHMKGFEAYVAIGSDGRMLGEDIKMHLRQRFTILNLTTKSKLRSV